MQVREKAAHSAQRPGVRKTVAAFLMQPRYGPRSVQMGVLEGDKNEICRWLQKKKVQVTSSERGSDRITGSFATIFYVFLLVGPN